MRWSLLFACAAMGACSSSDGDSLFAATVIDMTPPAFPGLSDIVADAPHSVVLSWDPATDDIARPDTIAYRIYVAPTSGAQDFSTPTSTFVGTNGGLVGKLEPGKDYFVVVRAADPAGNGETNSVERMTHTPPLPTPAPAPIRFGMQVAPLLARSCVEIGCHSQPEPQQGMDFKTSPATTFQALVGRRANQRSELFRVNPSDSGTSYLVRKLLGFISPSIDGRSMPPPPFFRLSDAEILTIREWIDQGAQNN